MSFRNGKAAAAACLVATVAPAQDAGGNRATFNVSQNLSYSNNLDFDAAETSGARAVTGLSFDYSTQTRVDQFSISASTNAIFSTDDGAENGFTDPLFQLSYGRSSKNAELNIGGSFRQAEVSSILGTEELIDAGFFTIDSGEQTDITYNASLELGKIDPIGATFSYSGNARRFTNTADPSLLDSDRQTLSAVVRLRFDDRISARITARQTEFDEDGGTNRITRRLGVGGSFAVTKTLTVDADVSYDETELTETGTTTVTDGLGFDLGVNQSLKGGAITAGISSSVNENGRRSTFRIGRQIELKNGSLGLTFGAVAGEGDGLDPLFGITYAQELPRGAQFSVQASQEFETNGAGDEAINTSLGLNYSAPLTNVSSLSASANFRGTNGFETVGDDASRLDISMSYRHELAQDWGLVGGYTRSFAKEDGEADRTADTVFVGLQKNFEWRP